MDVLIIDDDEMCLLMLSHSIQTSAFHHPPRCFKSAMEGLDYLRTIAVGSEPVIIFLDINMPEMNGWEFLEIIQEEFTEMLILVIVVTSSVSVADETKARSSPMVIDYIVKPVQPEHIQKIHAMIYI